MRTDATSVQQALREAAEQRIAEQGVQDTFTCSYCDEVLVGQEAFEDHLIRMGWERDKRHQ